MAEHLPIRRAKPSRAILICHVSHLTTLISKHVQQANWKTSIAVPLAYIRSLEVFG